MTKTKRILCTLLAAAMLLSSLLLSGCSAPKLTLGGTDKMAATVGETKITTGEYLAYLYNIFYNYYYSQGMYQYAQYGYDVWSQTYPYGEEEDAEQLAFGDYLKQLAQDAIVRQEAVRLMLAEQELSWNAEDEAKLDEQLKDLTEDAYLSMGFSNENFIKAYKTLSLNESSLFYGLYGEGGKRAVPEADRKAYFDENFLSYKIISMAMTDTNGAELDEAGQQEILDYLENYRAQYDKTGNFEAVVDAHAQANASDGAQITASTDESNRVNVDGKQADDQELVTAIRSVDVGKAKVVTYKANGTDLTAALILRLDPHQPATLFSEMTETILYGMKFEEFDKEVEEKIATIPVKFNKSVVKKCDPKNFVQE